MLICCGCGREFDEPVKQVERDLFWGRPVQEEYYVSPCCHEGFDEVKESEDEDDNI